MRYIPQQRVAVVKTGGYGKEEEAVDGEEIGNWEENWDAQEYKEEGGKIAEGTQGRGDTTGGPQG